MLIKVDIVQDFLHVNLLSSDFSKKKTKTNKYLGLCSINYSSFNGISILFHLEYQINYRYACVNVCMYVSA